MYYSLFSVKAESCYRCLWPWNFLLLTKTWRWWYDRPSLPRYTLVELFDHSFLNSPLALRWTEGASGVSLGSAERPLTSTSVWPVESSEFRPSSFPRTLSELKGRETSQSSLMCECWAISDGAERWVRGLKSGGGELPRGASPPRYLLLNVSLKCWGKVKCWQGCIMASSGYVMRMERAVLRCHM